jgi:hypothetical protein
MTIMPMLVKKIIKHPWRGATLYEWSIRQLILMGSSDNHGIWRSQSGEYADVGQLSYDAVWTRRWVQFIPEDGTTTLSRNVEPYHHHKCPLEAPNISTFCASYFSAKSSHCFYVQEEAVLPSSG